MRTIIAIRAVLLLLGLVRSSLAREEVISTESVQSCASESIITVNEFAVSYFPATNLILFNIQGRSLRNNVSPTINFEVIGYGKSFYNYSYDLCSLLDGGLCPLPSYNFTAIGEAPLPDNFQINLPGIAYTIPDLEAVAVVKLVDQTSGDLATCLEVTLSNGWTTGYPGVAWAAGGILIAAFVAAAVHSFFPLSPERAGPEWRFLTIIGFYQWIATCGILSLDYAGLYQVFTLNFAWSLGLINIHSFERSYDRTRVADGGRNVTGDSFSMGSLSYSFGVPQTSISNAAYAAADVTQSPVVDASRGIAQYVEQMGIPYPNTFVTVLVIWLLLCAVVAALLLLFFVALEIIIRRRGKEHDADWSRNLRQDASYAAITNALRTLLVGVFPLTMFAFYTFRTVSTSSWAYTLLAVLILIFLIAVAVCITIYIRHVRRYYDLDKLLFDPNHPDHHSYSRRWQALYAEFRPAFWWYIFPWIAVSVLRAAFVAFAQGSAWVQTVALLVIELVVFTGLVVMRPFRRKASNALEIFLSLVRIVSICLLIPSITSLGVNRYVVTGLGVGLLAIQSLVVVWFFILTMFNLGAGILWARKKHVVEKQPLPWETEARTPGVMTQVDPMMQSTLADEEEGLHSRPLSSSETTLADVSQPWTLKGERSSLKNEIMSDNELYGPSHPSEAAPPLDEHYDGAPHNVTTAFQPGGDLNYPLQPPIVAAEHQSIPGAGYASYYEPHHHSHDPFTTET